MIQILTGCLLGALLGARHVLEPDHLAAVSTLVTEERSRGRGAILGLFWGLGHALALLAVGLVLAALEAELPARVADLFELGVAVMLLALGVRALRQALRQGRVGPSFGHDHGARRHQHPGPRDHVHIRQWTLARRPLCVGLLHGLAGSGALTALALASLPTTATRLAYIALFGLGSAAGMAALSGLAGWPLGRLGRGGRASQALSALSGALSVGLGVAWGLPLLPRLLGS